MVGHQDGSIAVLKEVCVDSRDMTIVRLVRALAGRSAGYIVLFTGEGELAPVVGVYLRGEGGDEEGEKGGHVLFQLQPRFRLLRCAKGGVSFMEMIKTEVDKMSFADIAGGEDGELRNGPYRIGGAKGEAGISVDPAGKTVTLVSGEGMWEGDVGGGKDGEKGVDAGWEVRVADARMEVFAVTGGGEEEVQSEEMEVEVEESKVGSAEVVEAGARVEGEELLRRIQGFGGRGEKGGTER